MFLYRGQFHMKNANVLRRFSPRESNLSLHLSTSFLCNMTLSQKEETVSQDLSSISIALTKTTKEKSHHYDRSGHPRMCAAQCSDRPRSDDTVRCVLFLNINTHRSNVLGEYLCHPISEPFPLPTHQFGQAGLDDLNDPVFRILHIPGSIFAISRISIFFCFAFTSQRGSVIPGAGHIGAICTT